MNYAKRLLPFALFLFALCTTTPAFADGSGPVSPPVDDGGGVLAAAVFSGAASAIAFLRARRRKK